MNVSKLWKSVVSVKSQMVMHVGAQNFGHGVYDTGGPGVRKMFVKLGHDMDCLDFELFVPLYIYIKESV